MIAANQGLGQRILLVRRYLAMDMVLTCVLWMATLAKPTNLALCGLSCRLSFWMQTSL